MPQIKVSLKQLIKALDSLNQLMPKLENESVKHMHSVLVNMGSAETPTPERTKNLLDNMFDEIVCGRISMTSSKLENYSDFNATTDHFSSDKYNIEEWLYSSKQTLKKIELKKNFPVKRKKRFVEFEGGGGSMLIKDPHIVNLPSAFLYGYKKWDWPGTSRGGAPYRDIPGRDLIISTALLSLDYITKNSMKGLKNHIEGSK